MPRACSPLPVASDEAGLLDSGVAGHFDGKGVVAHGFEQAAHLNTGAVRTDEADEVGTATKGLEVGDHVASTAKHTFFTAVIENRNRGFRRDALHLTIDEMVEHDIANAEHADITVRFDYRGKQHGLLPSRCYAGMGIWENGIFS